MNIRRYLPGLLLGLVILLTAGGFFYWRGYRLMTHVAAPGSPGPAPEAKEGKNIKYWVSPMDPKYVSNKPGKDPMGMDLKPVYEGEEAAGAPGTIAVDPNTMQSMGVQIAKVEVRPLSRVIRAVGKVAYDESQLPVVNTKTDGWVTRLFIKITGEPVKKGQKLLSIYSRELVPAQREYLLALRNLKAIGKSPFPEVAEGARRLAESSRVRLEYFDITSAEIAALERTGEVKKNLTLLSPVTGIVTKRMVTQGQFVQAGMTLLEVADLTHVWVDTDIYEYELPWVKVGQKAVMTLEYLPGETYAGRIEYIYPYIKADTRTAKGRLKTLEDLEEAVMDGAVKRLRPKLMTVMAILMGLLPIMWATGTGEEMMKRIVAPMVGSVVTSFLLELLIYPCIFSVWKWNFEVKKQKAA